ncbi:MAG: hypothetical protein NVV60_00580 [Luteimonas sp.]|nr:hypothetical protein [Luteimonas sp.]
MNTVPSDGDVMQSQATQVERTRGAPVAPTSNAQPPVDTTPQPAQGRVPGAAQDVPAASTPPADAGAAAVPQADVAPAAPTSVDELVGRELSLGDQMYADGGIRPDTPEGYGHAVASGFDSLEFAARSEGNAEDVAALAEGKTLAGQLMHELQVPTAEAGEITRTLSGWYARGELTEDQRWDQKADTLDRLREKWGKDTDARIELAVRVSAQACKRLPWLGEILRAGAGNDPAIIERFAEIGLRQARRARRGK